LKGKQITVYTDEDVPIALVEALKRRGFNASSTWEKRNFSLADEEQLRFAKSIEAVFLTHNVKDFPRIHYEFMDRGESHAGLIIAKQVSIGHMLRKLLNLAAHLSAEDMENRLEYLSNW
jgi:hypothetical protein